MYDFKMETDGHNGGAVRKVMCGHHRTDGQRVLLS